MRVTAKNERHLGNLHLLKLDIFTFKYQNLFSSRFQWKILQAKNHDALYSGLSPAPKLLGKLREMAESLRSSSPN